MNVTMERAKAMEKLKVHKTADKSRTNSTMRQPATIESEADINGAANLIDVCPNFALFLLVWCFLLLRSD
jgi:hypothetical protein